MARSYKKEAEWARKVYKQFFFKCRTDNGELERLQAVLDGRPFADWVREKIAQDENGIKAAMGVLKRKCEESSCGDCLMRECLGCIPSGGEAAVPVNWKGFKEDEA